MEQRGQTGRVVTGTWRSTNGKAGYEVLYGVGWGEVAPRPSPTVITRPRASSAQRGASTPVAVRLLVASPATPAGRRQMAKRRRIQAVRVYRHALWRQISGLLIVLAIGIGCVAEGAGLWTVGTWAVQAWQWAGL
jgi:hypothetical protein